MLELSTNLDEFVCQCKEQRDLLESQFLEVKQSLEKLLELPQKVEQIEHKVETLKQEVADLKRQDSAKPPTFFGALDRNEYFTGRKKELENLEKAFDDMTDTGPDVRGVAGRKANVHGICGLGGCGKSSLAFEYAWRNMERYPGGVFVVNGESDDLMRRSFHRIYGEFLLNTQSNNRDEAKDFDQLLAQTLSWFGNRRDKWLLLVDNMDQQELSPCARTVFLGQWKRNSSGDILVTSRRNSQALCEDLALPSENCFDLDPLSVNESVEFLWKRIGLPSSCEDQDQGERELAQELGGLPLALEQAAAYIKALKCSIQLYLQQYRSQKLTLLNTKSAQPRTEIYNEARLAVQTTWLLNFNYVENDEKDPALGRAAAFVMKIAAYLSPDEIPTDVLNVGAPEIKHEDLKKRLEMQLGTNQIVEMLVRFSLFTQKSAGILSIHRLVQETLRDRCDSEGVTVKVLSSAVRMMHHAFLKCKGGTDFLSDLYEKMASEQREGQSHREELLQLTLFSLFDVPLETEPWKKLLTNAFYLVCNVLKDSSLKPHFLCEESARLFCEAAYYCYSLGIESQGYSLQQLVFEVLCAIKEPIRYYRDDVLLKVTKILRPFTDAALLRQLILLNSNNPSEKDSVCADDSNQKYELLETIKLMEPKAREAFSGGYFQKSIDLYTEIVKISNFNASRRGNLERQQPQLVPLGEILCHRGIAQLKMGNFETAVDDFNASICADIQLYRGYYWKAYALCKLVENGRTEFTSRAQAAAAVLHFKFADSKRDDIEKLQRKFQKIHRIEYKFVSRVSELKELESRLSGVRNEFSTDSLIIILADGTYDLKEMTILRGRYYFVCPPGCSACFCCTKGLFLSQGNFLFENVEFLNIYPFIPALTSSTTFGRIFRGLKVEEYLASKHFDTVTFGKRNPAETDLTARTERDVSALIEACDVHSLVIDHCEILGPPCTGIAIVFTEFSNEQNIISVSSSKITSCGKTGFQIQGNAPFCHISIHNNNLVHNLHGIVIDSPSRFYVENNYIFSNTLSGVVATGASSGMLRKNYFAHNGKHGILVHNSTAEVEENLIGNNRGWGIVCSCESNLHCKENVLESNLCGGCHLMFNGKGDVLVQGCEFRENSGPAIFPETANELCRMELKLKQSSSASWKDSFPFYKHFFLECIDPIYDSSKKFTSPVVRENRESDFSAVLFPDFQLTFCSACSKDLRQMDSDVIECPSCRVARYCGQPCSDAAKTVHNPVCKSILESNKACVDYDVFTLSGSPLPAHEDHDGKGADNSLCVIANVTLANVSGPLSDVEGMDTTDPFHCCLLMYPEKNLWTVIASPVIHHFISMYGIHHPDSMMDIKAACILANFDSESKKITVYMHRIFRLKKVPGAFDWVDRALKLYEQHFYEAFLKALLETSETNLVAGKLN